MAVCRRVLIAVGVLPVLACVHRDRLNARYVHANRGWLAALAAGLGVLALPAAVAAVRHRMSDTADLPAHRSRGQRRLLRRLELLFVSVRPERLKRAARLLVHSPLQAGTHLVSIGPPCVGHLLKRLLDRRGDLRPHAARKALVDRFQRLGHMLHHDRERVVRHEWQRSGDTFIEHDAERIQVAARIDRRAHRLLRAHVRRRAERLAGLRHRRVDILHDAKIQHFHDAIAARDLMQKDVGRLHVAMHKPVGVRFAEAAQHRDADVGRFDVRHGTARAHIGREHVLQRFAVQPLHREEQKAAVGLAEIEHAHGVGVRQPRRRSRFLKETPMQLVGFGCGALAQHLNRDGVARRRVHRVVNGAKTALPKQPGDPIAAANDLAFFNITAGAGDAHGPLRFTVQRESSQREFAPVSLACFLAEGM